jgi:nucleoside-diphosphate-sugar epimerase
VLPDPDTAHTFTFIDDFARALVNLGSHDETTGEVWHVPSAQPRTTRGFVEQVYAEAGTKLRLRAAPKFLGHALDLPNPTMKTLTERLHLTERAVRNGPFEVRPRLRRPPHPAWRSHPHDARLVQDPLTNSC